MEFQIIANFLNIASGDKDFLRFVTTKWMMINQEEIKMLTKKLELKLQC